MTDREIESHYYDIHTALLNTFFNCSYAIIVLEGYLMALIKQTDFFYSFDLLAKDFSGMPDPNSTAVVMKLTNILELEQYLYYLCIMSIQYVKQFNLLTANLLLFITVCMKILWCTRQKNQTCMFVPHSRSISHAIIFFFLL